MSRLVSAEIGSPIDESTILQALQQLERARLLAGGLEQFGGKTVGGRELLKKTGQLGAAATIAPVVASILVPTAAAAASAVTPFATFSGLAFYTGGVDELASGGFPAGGFQGCPDTGFLRITNNGPDVHRNHRLQRARWFWRGLLECLRSTNPEPGRPTTSIASRVTRVVTTALTAPHRMVRSSSWTDW